MATQTFVGKFSKNISSILSPDDLKDRYLFGISLTDPNTGREMTDATLQFFLDAAQHELEELLAIKINKQVYEETANFDYSQWLSWGYVPTNYPVNYPVSMDGYLNEVLQVSYPQDYLNAKTSSDGKYDRRINLVPATESGSSSAGTSLYLGVMPYNGKWGSNKIPNYWNIKYVTGWDDVPADILDFIGKLASINVFHIMGDLIVGAGIAQKSIGIDGLSQTVATTSSATNSGYGARVHGYLTDLKKSEKILRNTYKGFSLRAL